MEVRGRVARPPREGIATPDDVTPVRAGDARQFRVMKLGPPDGFGDRGARTRSRVKSIIRAMGAGRNLCQMRRGTGCGRGAFRRQSGHAIGCDPRGQAEQRNKQQPAEHAPLCRVAIGWVNHLGARHANSAGASLPRYALWMAGTSCSQARYFTTNAEAPRLSARSLTAASSAAVRKTIRVLGAATMI